MKTLVDMLNKNNVGRLNKELIDFGVVFEEGLSNKEIWAVQEKFQFIFPPDLKAFLKYALPVGTINGGKNSFPNWRDLNDDSLVEKMKWPLEGLFFDIKHNNFWLASLGTRPSNIKDAYNVMEKAFNDAPKLIPIWGHRYIPDFPNEINNPVLSVWQTDIIYYGSNLYDYFQTEMLKRAHLSSGIEPKPIEFWSEIINSD